MSNFEMKRFLRLPEVISLVGIPRSTIYLYIQQGRFPAQIKLGSRSVAWNSEEIDAWIQEKIDQSKTPD
jgi:prophage regulatory protein